MGYIDQTAHTLTCSCGETESQTIVERGSPYGSSWGSGKPFQKFTVVWKDGNLRGPEIKQATCKACGKTPAIAVA